MALVPDANYATVGRITVGGLRNGIPGQIRKCNRQAAIDAKWFFGSPRYDPAWDGNAANFAPELPANVLMHACIVSAAGQYGATVEANAVAAHAAAAAVAAAAGGAAPPPLVARAAGTAALADVRVRGTLIALGASRAASIHAYRITDADIKVSERVAPVYQLNAPAPGANAAALAAANATPTGGWTISLVTGVGPATDAEVYGHGFPALSDAEGDAAAMAFSMGLAAVTRAGDMLLTENHHYFSSAEKRRRHAAIEKEVLGLSTDLAKNVWAANTAAFQDAIWHKNPHPLEDDFLTAMAAEPEAARKLGEDGAGFGSMTVGLPSQEDLVNRAGSYLAVLDAVGPTAANDGHNVTLDATRTARDAVLLWPRRNVGAAGADPPCPAAIAVGGAWPAGVTDRRSAAKIVLAPILDAAAPVASWLFGYFHSVCDDAGISSRSEQGSLLRSYSLKKARAMHLPMHTQAMEARRLSKRYAKAQADEGNLEKFTYAG